MKLTAVTIGFLIKAVTAFRHRKLIPGSSDDIIDNRYIVTFQPDADPFNVLSRLSPISNPQANYLKYVDGEPTSQTAFLRDIETYELESLLDDPDVRYIEPDRHVHPHVVQRISWPYGNWGLDRIDDPDDKLNNRYHFEQTGENVEVYVLDTGTEDHSQLEDRVDCGHDPTDGDCRDSYGHGTHVAATIAGVGYGVAKDALIISVRVLAANNGRGSVSSVISGMDYVMGRKLQRRNTPMVVNMSLGTSFSPSLNDAVTRLSNSGVIVVVSAGNDDDDACNYSPSSSEDAITVGSIDKDNNRSEFSNYGQCVNIFAPGSDIRAASSHGGILDFFSFGGETRSGTSMAAPFVSGVAALYLDQYPSLSSSEVRDHILRDAAHKLVGDARSSSNLIVSSQALYESAAVRSDDEEMCTGVFGFCGAGIGCCRGRMCLPILGLCFIF